MKDGATLTKADFARRCGVTGACVSQWLRDGVIGREALVGTGRHARVRAELALAMLRERLDLTRSATNLDGPMIPPGEVPANDRKSELLAARTRTAGLQGQLLELKLAREHGVTISKAEAMADMQSLGRAVQRALRGVQAWGDELTEAARNGGSAAISELLTAKKVELLNSIDGLIGAFAAELAETPPDGGDTG